MWRPFPHHGHRTRQDGDGFALCLEVRAKPWRKGGQKLGYCSWDQYPQNLESFDGFLKVWWFWPIPLESFVLQAMTTLDSTVDICFSRYG